MCIIAVAYIGKNNKGVVMENNIETSEYLCEIKNSNKKVADKDIVEVLENVFDPDIHFSVYDIGLIYSVTVSETDIFVMMTLTSVNCPAAQSLPEEIKNSLKDKFPQLEVEVEITFEPMWTVDNMSEEIKLSLGLL